MRCGCLLLTKKECILVYLLLFSILFSAPIESIINLNSNLDMNGNITKVAMVLDNFYFAGITNHQFQPSSREMGLEINLDWSLQLDGKVIGKPIILDIDNDGIMEIIVGTEAGTVYVISPNGIILASSSGYDISPENPLRVYSLTRQQKYILTKKGNTIYLLKYESHSISEYWSKVPYEVNEGNGFKILKLAISDIDYDGNNDIIATFLTWDQGVGVWSDYTNYYFGFVAIDPIMGDLIYADRYLDDLDDNIYDWSDYWYPTQEPITIIDLKVRGVNYVADSYKDRLFLATLDIADISFDISDVYVAGEVVSEVISADLFNDEKVELIYSTSNGFITCYGINYNVIWEFEPKNFVRATPLIFDFDYDEYPEILIASVDGSVYLLNRSGEKIKQILLDPVSVTPSIFPYPKLSTYIIAVPTTSGIIYFLDRI